MYKYSVSVAIVTRNRSKLLEVCLQSLIKQEVKPSEVVVVDNGSTDSTREVCKTFSEILPIRYFLESKVGTAYARNKAIKISQSSILVFIDDDCTVQKDFVKEVVDMHERYPKVVAVQGRVENVPEQGIFSSVFSSHYRAWVDRNLQSDNRCFFLDTANASFKLSILKKKGLYFDTSFKYYCDDLDFAFQLLNKGEEILYGRRICVKALIKTNPIDFFRIRYLKGRAQAKLYFKWSFFQISKSFSIGDRRVKLRDLELIKFRELTINKQLEKFEQRSGGLLQQIAYRIVKQLSKLSFNKGFEHGRESVETQALQGEIAKFEVRRAEGLEVAIITRNRDKSLKRLLFTLTRQTMSPERVIIVDNGSSDQTKAFIKQFSGMLPILYIYEQKPSIPNARNRALRAARGQVLSFIDDDCQAPANWVEVLLSTHKNHPRVTAIQGRSLNLPEGSIFTDLFNANYSFWLAFNSYKRQYLQVCDTKNLSIKVKLVKESGIKFDQNFRRGSDVDFAKQLINKGFNILYKPEVKVWHWGRGNIWSFAKQIYQSGRSQMRLDFKWPQLQKVFQDSDRDLYKKIARNIGGEYPGYKRFIIRLLFRLFSKVFEMGAGQEKEIILSNFIKGDQLKISSMAASREDFSVAIVTKNRPYQLARCLLSLVNQTKSVKEIVIVDGSDDKSTQSVVNLYRKYLPIRYAYEPTSGISRARNKVMQMARGSIVACIDDDCEADPEWVDQMIKGHKKYPDAIAIQGSCKVFPKTGVVSRVVQIDYNSWVSRNLKDNNELLIIDLENSSFKREVLKRLKVRFDDSFKTNYYCEDVDLGFQLLYREQKIMFWPDAKVVAWRRESLLLLMRQRILKGLSRAALDFKWSLSNSEEGLTLRGKTFFYDKKSSNIKRIMAAPFSQRINFFSPLLVGLPKIGLIGRVFEPLVLFVFHKLFMFSYKLQRTRLNSDFQRLNKDPKREVAKLQRKLTLSVMIITKDRHEYLRSCLDSLMVQTYIPDEVIIVDSSEVSVRELISEFSKVLNIRYVYLLGPVVQRKRGFGVARNAAMSYAKTDLIATLDDDAFAQKDWCLNIIKAHSNYPSAAAIQGRIYSVPKGAIISIVEQLHIEKWFLMNMDRDNNLGILTTKNTSFKLDAFKKLRLKFKDDLLFGLYGAEDKDVAFQLISLKQKIIYVPNIVVYHSERSSLWQYLKQQYRKGYSNGLINHIWKEDKHLKNSYFPLPKFLEPVYWCWIYSGSRKNILFAVQSLVTYYLAEISFSRGRLAADQRLKKLHYLVSKNKEVTSAKSSEVVILISQKNCQLEKVLFSLVNQTVLPTKIIIVDRTVSNRNVELAGYFGSVAPIEYLRANTLNVQVLKNEMILRLKSEIVAFIDDSYLPAKNWIEEIIKGHRKYPKALVLQGRTFNLPRGGGYSSVVQFNRQNLVRDAMGRYRGLYWEWIHGRLKRDFPIFSLDLLNASFKIKEIKQVGIRFIEEGVINADAHFSAEIYQKKSSIIFYPKIYATSSEGGGLDNLVRRGVTAGRLQSEIDHYAFPEYLKLNEKIRLKRIFTFVFYCLKNRYFLSMPGLVLAYVIYQASLSYGSKMPRILNINKELA